MNWAAAHGKLKKSVARKFNRATSKRAYKKLPERVKRKRAKTRKRRSR